VWGNLGVLYEQQQRYGDAEKAYEKAAANQHIAFDAAPNNSRYRALLSSHYWNLARILNKQEKYGAAVEAAIQRKQLWRGNADRLYSAAQQLAGTYRLMQAASTPPQSQAECASGAVETLREALTAGLPTDRLKDKSLASLASSEEFRKLIGDPKAKALSRTN
jgi:tetratricopeptide (TPR) repeat protein